jgi:Carboxypeptidase regulatory-like domain
LKKSIACALICASFVLAQTATSLLEGNVADPQGAAITGAEIAVVNTDTAAAFKTTSDERGHWALPSMAAGSYRVTVSMKGFRTTTVEGVSINAGVPAAVNVKLEVGQLAETISVSAGAEMLQTSNATVTTTLDSRQVSQLPFASRNAMELLVSQPGTQTGTTARNSFINGVLSPPPT